MDDKVIKMTKSLFSYLIALLIFSPYIIGVLFFGIVLIISMFIYSPRKTVKVISDKRILMPFRKSLEKSKEAKQ